MTRTHVQVSTPSLKPCMKRSFAGTPPRANIMGAAIGFAIETDQFEIVEEAKAGRPALLRAAAELSLNAARAAVRARRGHRGDGARHTSGRGQAVNEVNLKDLKVGDTVECWTCGRPFPLAENQALTCPPCRVRAAEIRLLVCPCEEHERQLAERERAATQFEARKP